jgi:predicted CopG family antitoxin
MRKTIDLTDENIKTITEYQKRNGLKNFSEAVRNLIDSKKDTDVDIEKIKMEVLNTHVAPKSAGEIG